MLIVRAKNRCLGNNANVLRIEKSASLLRMTNGRARSWSKRSTDINALLKDVQIESSKEEYALGMGQRKNSAIVKDAQTMLSEEDYACGMGQRSNYVFTKDAQIMS